MNRRRWPSRPGEGYPPGEYLQGRDGLGQAAQPRGTLRAPTARRWPPAGPPGPGSEPPAPYLAQFEDLRRAIGDLSDSIGKIAPLVIGNRLVALDANGQGADQFRTPFQALAITSASASTLIVAAAPLQAGASAPGPGPGVTLVQPRGFRIFNAKAHAFSIYGGNAGDLVYVEAFAVPQPPHTEAGPLTGAALGALALASDYPLGAVPIVADSGNQANAAATATLAAAATAKTWITGFEVTGSGATGALVVTVTVTIGGGATLHYTYVFVAGATLANESLIVEFPKPIPTPGVNQTIAVSCPASGLGGTNNTVVAHGYQL